MARNVSISIPERDRTSVETVFGLSSSKRQKTLDVLRLANPSLDFDDIGQRLTDEAGLKSGEARSVISVLQNTYNTAEQSGEDIAFVVSKLAEATKRYRPESKITNAKIEQIQAFISEALSSSSLNVTAKASRVMVQHSNVFIRAEIFSDVRGVFGAGPEPTGPQAAVIVHNLKITHGHNNEYIESYFSMDYNDIVALRATLDRAIFKHGGLEKMISAAGVSYLSNDES